MSDFPESVVEDDYHKPTHMNASSFVEKNRAVHLMRVDEITLLSKLIGGETGEGLKAVGKIARMV